MRAGPASARCLQRGRFLEQAFGQERAVAEYRGEQRVAGGVGGEIAGECAEAGIVGMVGDLRPAGEPVVRGVGIAGRGQFRGIR